MRTRARSQSSSSARPVDRCTICGQFVGRYPVGFCCDTHCSRCVCRNCPPAIINQARAWGERIQ